MYFLIANQKKLVVEFKKSVLNRNFSFFIRRDDRLGLGYIDCTFSKLVPTFLMKIENVKTISTAEYHTFILKKDGEMIGFGSNDFKKLSVNSKQNEFLSPQTIMKDENIQSVDLSGLNNGMYILLTDTNKQFKFLKN